MPVAEDEHKLVSVYFCPCLLVYVNFGMDCLSFLVLVCGKRNFLF